MLGALRDPFHGNCFKQVVQLRGGKSLAMEIRRGPPDIGGERDEIPEEFGCGDAVWNRLDPEGSRTTVDEDAEGAFFPDESEEIETVLDLVNAIKLRPFEVTHKMG